MKELNQMSVRATSLAQTYFERLVSGNSFQLLSGLACSDAPTYEADWLEFRSGLGEGTNGSQAASQTRLRPVLPMVQRACCMNWPTVPAILRYLLGDPRSEQKYSRESASSCALRS